MSQSSIERVVSQSIAKSAKLRLCWSDIAGRYRGASYQPDLMLKHKDALQPRWQLTYGDLIAGYWLDDCQDTTEPQNGWALAFPCVFAP